MRPYVVLGPSVAYRLNARLKDETTGEEAEEDEDAELEEDIAKWDYGVSAGGGLSVVTGGATVFVEGRYTWGLANLTKDVEEGETKNRGAQILVGVTFPVGRR